MIRGVGDCRVTGRKIAGHCCDHFQENSVVEIQSFSLFASLGTRQQGRLKKNPAHILLSNGIRRSQSSFSHFLVFARKMLSSLAVKKSKGEF